MTNTEIQQIANIVTQQTMFLHKEILNAKEAAQYLGIKMGTLYKLTCYKQIPFYKPMNGFIYFNRQELNKWMMSDRYKF